MSPSLVNGGEVDPHVAGGLDKTASELDKITLEEDDIHEIAEEERGKLNDVDYLTGSPLPTDILLYAVPVCGPYSAVQSYKYRVKITPGSTKKGKGTHNYRQITSSCMFMYHGLFSMFVLCLCILVFD